jgi:hypothetical protein
MRAIVKYAGGLVAFYILVFVLLSSCGSYQPCDDKMYESSIWAPAGFYDPFHTESGSITTAAKRNGTWHRGLAITFLPLWDIDISYVHKTRSRKWD